jgi:hypothetical protein
MGKFSAQVLKGTTSTTVGVGSLAAPAANMRRIRLAEIELGSDAGTLGTSNFRWEVQRSTTQPTGTAVTPQALDPAEGTVTAVVNSNLTVAGTLTAGAILLTIPLSQQATFRWVANPGWEIVIPAAANNGIHLNTAVAGNTPSAAAQFLFEE